MVTSLTPSLKSSTSSSEHADGDATAEDARPSTSTAITQVDKKDSITLVKLRKKKPSPSRVSFMNRRESLQREVTSYAKQELERTHKNASIPKPITKSYSFSSQKEEMLNDAKCRMHSGARSSTKDDLEFANASHAIKRTNVLGGVVEIVRGCLGGGMVTIHVTYRACGLWSALVINLFLGSIISYSMYKLTTSAQKMYARLNVVTMSYPDLAEAALEFGPLISCRRFGRFFRHIVEVLVCINLLGACSVYQVMMGRSIMQLVEGTEDLVPVIPTMRLYILALLPACAILGVCSTLKILAPFSIVSDFFIVLLVISTVFYGINAVTESPLDMPVFKTLSGLFEHVGVALFSMDGIGVTLAVENSLKDQTKYPLVLVSGMTVVVLLVTVTGFFGYWGFGEKCCAPITINFPWGIFSINLKMFMALMIYVTFGLNFWLPSSLVWYYVSVYHNTERHRIYQPIYKMLLTIVTFLIAFAVPNVSKSIALLGCFCVTSVSFVFPALITLIIEWDEHGAGKYYWRVLKAAALIVLGSVLFIVGTFFNGKSLIMWFLGSISDVIDP